MSEVEDKTCCLCYKEYYSEASSTGYFQRVPEKSTCWRHFYDDDIKNAVIISANSPEMCPQCLSTCQQIEVLDDRLEEIQMEIDRLIHQFTSNLLKSRKTGPQITGQVEHIKVEPSIAFLDQAPALDYYGDEEYGFDDESQNLENAEVKVDLEKLGSDGNIIEDDIGDIHCAIDKPTANSTVKEKRSQICKCDICGKLMASKRNLQWHKKVHSEEKPFSCKVCGKSFRLAPVLKRHMTSIHAGERPFRCHCCGISFATKYHFTRHTTSRTHLLNRSSPRADIPVITKRKTISKAPKIPALPLKTYRPHKLSKEAIIRQIKTSSVDTLAEGQKVIPPLKLEKADKLEKEKIHKCHVCGKAFGERNKLVEHFRKHTGERPFNCSFCFKSFRLRSFLIIHERIHTGYRPFSCHPCGLAFIQKSGLNDHCKTQKHLDKLTHPE